MILTDVLNLLTDIPFAEFGWSSAPKGKYGVVSFSEQAALMTDENPVSEKVMTGYVDVFVTAKDDDPTEAVEGAMSTLGVWFKQESVQYEDDTGLIHIEWRWADVLNTKSISLPMMLHVKNLTWSDGDLFCEFVENPSSILAAFGSRDVAFYVPVEEELTPGLTVTVNYLVRLSAYTESGNHKTATFTSLEDGEERYLRIFVDVEASSCSGQGSFADTAYPTLIFETSGIVDDPRFTYRTLKKAFETRTPVYIYEAISGTTRNVYTLAHMASEPGLYKATFLSSNFENSMVWSFMATDQDTVMDEV